MYIFNELTRFSISIGLELAPGLVYYLISNLLSYHVDRLSRHLL